jgi:flagellar hook-basal body complex protein FliE
MTITPIRLPVAPPIAEMSAAASTGGADPFAQAFSQAVSSVQQFQDSASTSIGKFLSGEGEELHRVALQTQQAQLSFDLFLQVRNKVVAAYQEVMRMQV